MNDPHAATRVRAHDCATSAEGAANVGNRAWRQRDRLLAAFATSPIHGLTDEQAGHAAGLETSCYWKRCGELRAEGLIAATPETRKGRAGISRTISIITSAGRARLDLIRRMEQIK